MTRTDSETRTVSATAALMATKIATRTASAQCNATSATEMSDAAMIAVLTTDVSAIKPTMSTTMPTNLAVPLNLLLPSSSLLAILRPKLRVSSLSAILPATSAKRCLTTSTSHLLPHPLRASALSDQSIATHLRIRGPRIPAGA